MHYELFAVLSIIFCLLVLGGEYLWLAILAKRQEDSKNKYTAGIAENSEYGRGHYLQPYRKQPQK